MSEQGWRSLVIENGGELSLDGGELLFTAQDGTKTAVPISQLRSCLLQTAQCSITAPLIQALAAAGVPLILCDRSFSPACELIPLGRNEAAVSSLPEQIEWSRERKDIIWQRIVEEKLRNQIFLLDRVGLAVPELLGEYCCSVRPGDPDNREGQGARVYFRALFGDRFIRHTADDLNAALNYGYAILRSSFDRAIASHGYHMALGIHHCSRQNPFNLSCDLMEPFRPFVDEIVYEQREKPFDREFRRQLLRLPQRGIRCGTKNMQLQYAVDEYTQDILNAMQAEEIRIRRIAFD